MPFIFCVLAFLVQALAITCYTCQSGFAAFVLLHASDELEL
jgi:hypothetical protein